MTSHPSVPKAEADETERMQGTHDMAEEILEESTTDERIDRPQESERRRR